jgi:hypothetical protein
MIHVVFNEAEVELMQQVMSLDESLYGSVVQIKDDFAVGPLHELDTEEGWQARLNWWMTLLEHSPYAGSSAVEFDDRKTVDQLKAQLTENPAEHLWIWMGQNQHDVSGYYWLMRQFKDFAGRVMVLYLNNLPFINEKGQIFYPSWLNEIQPKEFLKAKKLARPITLSEFEVDPDEWKKTCDENSMVRILEGGKKLAGKDESFYDSEIVKNITPDWQKATRVLSNTLNRMKIKTGDVFLMWRMKQLVQSGKIDVTGDMGKSWKDFDVRVPGAKGQAEPVSEVNAEM